MRGKYTSAKFLPGFRSLLYCYSVTLAKVHRGMNLPVIWVMEYFRMLWGVRVWKAAPRSRDGEQPSPRAGVQCSQTPLALCTEDLFAVYLLRQCPRPVRCGNAVFVCAGKAKRCLIGVDGDLGRRKELRTGGGRQSKVLLGRWAGNASAWLGMWDGTFQHLPVPPAVEQPRALHFWIREPDSPWSVLILWFRVLPIPKMRLLSTWLRKHEIKWKPRK